MAETPRPREIVDRLGGHPSSRLGLDLERESDLDHWLLASCLLAQPGSEARAMTAFGALYGQGPMDATRVEKPLEQLATALASSGWRRPEGPAHLLYRVARGVRQQGGCARLAREAEDLEDLASRLSSMASGLGKAAIARFLRPLRDHWPAAVETPLSPAARRAAQHLGWLGEDADESGEPGALRAHLREDLEAPALADVESALERLGAASCQREALDRCPLEEHCPARRRVP